MNKFIQYSFISLLIVLLFCLVGTILLLWMYDYEHFSSYVLAQLGKEHLNAIFQKIFPKQRYEFIQYFLWVTVAIYGLFMFYLLKKSAAIAQKSLLILEKVSTNFHSQIQNIQQLSKLEKILLGTLIGTSALLTGYRICELDLIYDEIWTYLYFTQHPPIMAMATYPAPNNHILFSLMSSILHQFGLSDIWALRMPVFACSILTNLVFWLFVNRYLNRQTAFFSLSFFAFCLPIAFYSVYGRGYILIVFFSLLSLWALLKWLEMPEQKMSIGVFILATVAGFYSMPTFLYVYLLWGFFVCIFSLSSPQNRFFLFKFIRVSIVVAALTFVLYSPILLVYGFGHAFNNMSQFNIDTNELLQRFPNYFIGVLDFLGGHPYLAMILWLFPFFCLLKIRQNTQEVFQRRIIYITCMALLFPILFYFLQRSQIPTRVWTFEALFLSLSMGLLVTFFIKNKSINTLKIALFCVIIAALSIFFTQSNSFWKNIQQSTKQHHKIAQYIVQQKANTCFLNYYIIKPHLEYYNLKQNRPMQLYMAQKGSVDYYDLKNTDKIDVLVIGKQSNYAESLNKSDAFWNNYILTYEDEEVWIYQLKRIDLNDNAK